MDQARTAPQSTRRPVDSAALRHVRRRLAAAPAPPWLHGEVAGRMAERLPVIVQKPRTVLDWWGRLGASEAALSAAYPKAIRWTGEPELPSNPATSGSWLARWRSRAAQAFATDAVPRGEAQLLWANMMLHWVADPQAEMRRWFDLVAVDGFLMFSTLGPGTLESMRDLYAAAGWPAPYAAFVDMHDLGDMLVQAGFADPVMDQESLTLHWPDASGLLHELRGLGGNADPARFAGLRTPRWRYDLLQRLAVAQGRPALSFEVIYGHAFRPAPRIQVAAQSSVGLDDMRSILQRRR